MVDFHHALLQAAVAGTDFYEDYTGIKLPLPKLDMVAIPGKRGAVEHWGLLQFDEERMLVDKVGAHCLILQGACVPVAGRQMWQEMELQLRIESNTWHRLRLEVAGQHSGPPELCGEGLRSAWPAHLKGSRRCMVQTAA